MALVFQHPIENLTITKEKHSKNDTVIVALKARAPKNVLFISFPSCVYCYGVGKKVKHRRRGVPPVNFGESNAFPIFNRLVKEAKDTPTLKMS